MIYTTRAVTLSDATWHLLEAMSGPRTVSGTIEAITAEAAAIHGRPPHSGKPQIDVREFVAQLPE